MHTKNCCYSFARNCRLQKSNIGTNRAEKHQAQRRAGKKSVSREFTVTGGFIALMHVSLQMQCVYDFYRL